MKLKEKGMIREVGEYKRVKYIAITKGNAKYKNETKKEV